jgi:murein DD-endopeptidase MepM/ murein hydrolase activator NlpD
MPTHIHPKIPPVSPPPAPPPPVISPPTPPPSPPPVTAVSLGDPIGAIGGPLKIAYGRGAPWADVNRYDALFLAAGAKHGVPPAMLKAMAVIESGGQMIPNAGGSGAFGIMQIKTAIWGARAKALGYDLTTPAGQIGMAAAILGGATSGVTGATPEERFLSTYYPTPGLDVPGEDGATPRQYLADMHELMTQIAAAAAGTTPAPAPSRDVLDLLFGDKPYDVTATYGQLVTWRCDGCYTYFIAYGLDAAHHWAYDASARAGDGAPLYAPFDGQVVCAGTGNGPGSWGTGCGFFQREDNYGGAPSGTGAGRLELLHADGARSLILGHVLSSRVHPGDRVALGDLIGQQGGMNASHCHVEARYANGTKIGDPRVLFPGGPAYAEPVDVPQPDDDPPYVIVRATKVTPVLLRANPAAPAVLDPLQPGTEFHAQHKLIGADGRWYWVGRLRGRVAEADTEVVKTVLA